MFLKKTIHFFIKKLKTLKNKTKIYYLNQQKGINVSTTTEFGRNVYFTTSSQFWKHFKNGAIITGNFCKFSRNSNLLAYGGTITFGDYSGVGEGVNIYGHGNVTVGKNCLIAMGSCILSSNHSIPNIHSTINSQPDILLPTLIEDDVWIGANSVILGGITIGKGAVIAAGSVVHKDIPPYAIAAGNPVRIIKYRSND